MPKKKKILEDKGRFGSMNWEDLGCMESVKSNVGKGFGWENPIN